MTISSDYFTYDKAVFLKMTDAAREVWLTALRERRLSYTRQHEAIKAERQKIADAKKSAKVDKLLAKLEKQLVKLTDHCTAIEKTLSDIHINRIIHEGDA